MAILIGAILMFIVSPLIIRGLAFMLATFGPGTPLFGTFLIAVVIYQVLVKRK